MFTGVDALEHASLEGGSEKSESTIHTRSLTKDPDQPVYYGLDNVDEGDFIVITCRMSRFQAPRWTHNDADIDLDNGRISFNYSESFDATRLESLIIRHAHPSDTGAYRCSSRSRNGHFINVIALRPNDRRAGPSLRDKLKQIVYLSEKGSSVQLDCKHSVLNPHSPVVW